MVSKISFFNLEYLVFDPSEQDYLGIFVPTNLGMGKFRLARILAEWELLPWIGILIKR